jgi:hypothetical protein
VEGLNAPARRATRRLDHLVDDAAVHADARHAVPRAIAWQNVAYNQPPHPSFFLGNGMTMPPPPSIYTVAANPLPPGDFNGDRQVGPGDLAIWRATFGMSSAATPLPGDGDDDGVVDGADFLLWQRSSNPLCPWRQRMPRLASRRWLSLTWHMRGCRSHRRSTASAEFVYERLAAPLQMTMRRSCMRRRCTCEKDAGRS